MTVDQQPILAFVGKKKTNNVLQIQQLPGFSDAISLSKPANNSKLDNTYQFIYPDQNPTSSIIINRTSASLPIQLTITPNSLILTALETPISPELMVNMFKSFIVKKGNTGMYLTTRPKKKVRGIEKNEPHAITESRELLPEK
ncbi:hypothetical protein D1B31_15775 [Neobacillus notoginsengisoli]|uniref:Uncharacterized protein n=1 Tax=Neobacillus notoginsengisoli TaxID=1578198 RepID=A0A417YRA4_9BACI|nr:hypothetical protein [Neobacillus notoginsengisoli]RHW37229.1 hypothetical protein D1B31_15775 [Neobacillus notoginsengisoli]